MLHFPPGFYTATGINRVSDYWKTIESLSQTSKRKATLEINHPSEMLTQS